MAIKHNNAIPNNHFRKWWQRHVKTWFNQAGRKNSRRVARQQKAAKLFPRPVGSLRPAVHPPTVRYNFKLRVGRGFTLDELKKVGVTKQRARTIGISVDHRRRNRCEESLNTNVARLETYLKKVMVLPRKSGKKAVKKGDTPRPEAANIKQNICKSVIPIVQESKRIRARPITALEKESNAYRVLRKARENERNVGRLIKKAEAAKGKEN